MVHRCDLAAQFPLLILQCGRVVRKKGEKCEKHVNTSRKNLYPRRCPHHAKIGAQRLSLFSEHGPVDTELSRQRSQLLYRCSMATSEAIEAARKHESRFEDVRTSMAGGRR